MTRGRRRARHGDAPLHAPARAPVDRLRRGDVLPEVTLVDQDGRPVQHGRSARPPDRPDVHLHALPRAPVLPALSRRFPGELPGGRWPRTSSAAHDARLLSVTLEPESTPPDPHGVRAIARRRSDALGVRRWRPCAGHAPGAGVLGLRRAAGRPAGSHAGDGARRRRRARHRDLAGERMDGQRGRRGPAGGASQQAVA